MRRLAAIAPAACTLYLVLVAVVPDGWRDAFHRVAQVTALVLASSTGILAAAAFARGEALRRAWLTGVAGYLLAALMAATAPAAGETVPDLQLAIAGVAALGANVVAIVALWFFAGAYRAAGLEVAAPPGLRRRVRIAASLLTLVFCGYPFARALHHVILGELDAVVPLFASAGDLVIFQLLVGLLMTALALRGGLLAWPWAFLVVSDLAWFLVDAQPALPDLFPGASPAFLACWTDFWMIAGCGLTASASLAQRLISSRAP